MYQQLGQLDALQPVPTALLYRWPRSVYSGSDVLAACVCYVHVDVTRVHIDSGSHFRRIASW